MTTGGPASAAEGPEFSVSRDRLVGGFAGSVDAQTVEEILEDSWRTLAATGAARDIPLLAERFARERLQARVRVAAPGTRALPAAMFLCTHNAGRSQMAAGWFNHLAAGAALVFTGGSDPAADVNPVATQAMAEVGIDISMAFPKPWSDEVLRSVDVVVTMGCGDSCPVVPGVRYVDWELDDPAGQPIEVVRPIRDEIKMRVTSLLAELGVTLRPA